MSHTLTHPFTLLFASIFVLFLGPILHTSLEKNKNILRVIDGFTLIVIVLLVLVHILPECFHDIGFWAAITALVGVHFPTFFEKNMHRAFAKKAHIFALILALVGISLHSFTDGLALVRSDIATEHLHISGLYLPLAVILHRLPVGLTIWWLLRPNYGNKSAVIVLVFMSLASILGYYTGDYLIFGLEHKSLAFFKALVAGTLLHVIFHRHDSYEVPASLKGWQWASGLGALLGILIILLINQAIPGIMGGQQLAESAQVFLSLASKSAPALVFAYLASGLIQAFLPTNSINWLRKGKTFSQSLKGMAFGLPLPICSCGVVPVYRTLIKQGAPLSAAIAFFVATPELGLDAIFLSIPLLGGKMTLIRVCGAAIVALVIGWQIGIFFKDQNQSSSVLTDNKNLKRSLNERLREGLKTGFVDVVDHTGPWILLGLAVAAVAQPYLSNNDLFRNMPQYLQIPFFALIGMPVYVCATGATPLVAVLIFNGVSPGAALAFLLTGPATNITTFGILKQLHGQKMAFTFAFGMAILSIALGYVVNLFFGQTIHVASIPIGHIHPSSYHLFFLLILALIYLASLLRCGPRFLLNQIIAFDAPAEKHHCH